MQLCICNIAELPRRINPDIPTPLEEIIVHAMEKNPDDRYQTAVEMMRDIDRFKADPDVKFGYITRSQDTDAQTRYFAAVNDAPEETYNDNDYMQPPDDTYDQNDIYEDTYDEDYTDFEEDEKPAKKSLFVPILFLLASKQCEASINCTFPALCTGLSLEQIQI